MKTIETTLRNAARKSGMSMAELARRAAVPYAVAHKFCTTDEGISLRSAAKIAKVLQLELKPKG